MRRVDDTPIDPEIAASLAAIDAAMAGEPVDPRHADLAELTLLLVAERPRPGAGLARTLDERVERRFAEPATGPGQGRARRWSFGPVAGATATALAAGVAIVFVLSSGGSGPASHRLAPVPAKQVATSAASSSGPTPAAGSSASGSSAPAAPTPAPAGGNQGAVGPNSSLAANGRKIVQSAQLALSAAPDRIDDVAQQVFDVIGRSGGVVNSSTVTQTGGQDGFAQFQLTVPSATLPQTMAALSRLRYATVASRTDATQDVNNQFVDATRRLADARALRTSLLKQLANATTQDQVNSLQAQIRDAEASISSDLATLRTLNRQVDNSQIALTINANAVPVSSGGSFTIGKGAHDAGRVLTVAAGAALIVLAVLVPVGLLAALAWWVAAAVRRRRREQALELA